MRYMVKIFPIWLAVTLLSSCFLLKPKTTESYYAKAKHYEAEGDLVMAEKNITKAIGKSPDYIEAYLYRADLNVRMDSLVKGIADYTKVLYFQTLSVTKRGEILYLRANAYYLNVQDSLACKDWNASCEDYGYIKACTKKRTECKK